MLIFIQCFNQQNSSHRIYYCESSTESKFDVRCQHWNQQLKRCIFSKVIECLEQNIWKQIKCKRPSSKNKEENSKYSN